MREVVLDIRTFEEFARGHLPGAVLVPTPFPPLDQLQQTTLKEQLRALLEGATKKRKIYVYCKKGKRAKVAVKMLKKMGFDVTSLGGVEDGWLAEQLRLKKLKLVYG